MTTTIQGVVAKAAAHGPSELTRIDYLDGWRGLAIVFVLQEHFFGFPGMDLSRLGVDIFFCLSGFLMSRILFVKRVPLSTFYKRRVSRILPVFLLFVISVYGTTYLLGAFPGWIDFLAAISFLRTYIPVTPDIWSTDLPIGHLWSLNVEEHSYLLLSLVTLVPLARGREGPLLIALGTGAILMHVAYIKFPSIAPATYGLRTETAASYLLIAAGYCLIRDRMAPYVKPWMPLVALVLGVLCYTELFPWWASILLAPFLLALALNHLSQTYRAVLRAFAFAPLRLLGIWSYSIYLWQQPFHTYKEHLFSGNTFIGVAAAVAVGILSFYVYENPTRSWLNKNW